MTEKTRKSGHSGRAPDGRSESMRIRVSPQEKRKIQRMAHKHHLTNVSEYVRLVCIGELAL